MKTSVAVEIDETDSSTQTESLIDIIPKKMSEPELETSRSVSITFEENSLQIKAVTDLFTQQLAHLLELKHELGNDEAHRRHEYTT